MPADWIVPWVRDECDGYAGLGDGKRGGGVKRTQSALMRELLSENEKCELCGSKRSLEVHHIIPIVCGGEESADNMIVICSKCHALLTPKGLLTRIGLNKASSKNLISTLSYSFYKKLNTTVENRERLDAFLIMDLFDETVGEVMCGLR